MGRGGGGDNRWMGESRTLGALNMPLCNFCLVFVFPLSVSVSLLLIYASSLDFYVKIVAISWFLIEFGGLNNLAKYWVEFGWTE